MIKFRKTKEEKTAKLAANLIKSLNDLGRKEAQGGDAVCIYIYEYSHIKDELSLQVSGDSIKEIKFNHKGELK